MVAIQDEKVLWYREIRKAGTFFSFLFTRLFRQLHQQRKEGLRRGKRGYGSGDMRTEIDNGWFFLILGTPSLISFLSLFDACSEKMAVTKQSWRSEMDTFSPLSKGIACCYKSMVLLVECSLFLGPSSPRFS